MRFSTTPTSVDSLKQALADCVWVVGTTVRNRRLGLAAIGRRAVFAARAVEETRHGQVALVFGREQAGLSNQELDLCQGAASIATNGDFSSLNLAAAVQIFAYELQLAFCGNAGGPDAPSWGADEVQRGCDRRPVGRFVRHTWSRRSPISATTIAQAPKLLMRRLRRLYARARPDRAELNILRGILAATQRSSENPAHDPP